MADQKARLRARLAKLRELTTARGCTEEEATAAAEKLAALMHEHGLSEADLVMDEQMSPSGRGRSIRAKLWPVIAHCTNTAEVIITTDGLSQVQFIGRVPGPEIAVYLRDVCESAIDRGVREFKKSRFYRLRRGLKSKRAAVADFTDGMANRLRYRLKEVFAATINPEAAAEASGALEARYSDLTTVKAASAPLRHNQARFAGWSAGERVTLAHGVKGEAAPLQIGGGS